MQQILSDNLILTSVINAIQYTYDKYDNFCPYYLIYGNPDGEVSILYYPSALIKQVERGRYKCHS